MNGHTNSKTEALLAAKLLLEVWHPDKTAFIVNPRRRRYKRMEWRIRGLVLHDRALNDEWSRVLKWGVQ